MLTLQRNRNVTMSNYNICEFGYNDWMDKSDVKIPTDRLRAGEALSRAIKRAKKAGRISGDEDVAAFVGFGRTNISHHRKGLRKVAREIVLKYAEILDCDPIEIADDEVRMQLQQDLARYQSDAEDYVKIAEYRPTDHAPIKFLREDLRGSGTDPADLVTIRLDSADGQRHGDVAVCARLPENTVKSGELHGIDKRGVLSLMVLQSEGDGVILSPENPASGMPSYKTYSQMNREGITIVGVVAAHMRRFF